jgi:hypothetical protein
VRCCVSCIHFAFVVVTTGSDAQFQNGVVVNGTAGLPNTFEYCGFHLLMDAVLLEKVTLLSIFFQRHI